MLSVCKAACVRHVWVRGYALCRQTNPGVWGVIVDCRPKASLQFVQTWKPDTPGCKCLGRYDSHPTHLLAPTPYPAHPQAHILEHSQNLPTNTTMYTPTPRLTHQPPPCVPPPRAHTPIYTHIHIHYSIGWCEEEYRIYCCQPHMEEIVVALIASAYTIDNYWKSAKRNTIVFKKSMPKC